MPGEVSVDVEKQLLRVQFTSDSTIDNWEIALAQIERRAKETGIYRVLVDVRRQTALASPFELFEFGSHLPRTITFAVLYETHAEDHHFIETVAINRGINVRGFEKEQDAVEWLQKWPNSDA